MERDCCYADCPYKGKHCEDDWHKWQYECAYADPKPMAVCWCEHPARSRKEG